MRRYDGAEVGVVQYREISGQGFNFWTGGYVYMYIQFRTIVLLLIPP